MGICTNKEEGLARSVLKRLGLHEYFSTIVGGWPGRHSKPSPIPLLEAMRQLGSDRDSVVMVGDNEVDVGCAKAACVKVICVSFGYSQIPAVNLGADVVIDDYAEFEAACQFLRDRRS